MKIGELDYHNPDWGFIELDDGTVVELPKEVVDEIRKTKHTLWMVRAMRDEDKVYNATEEILHYRAEHPDTKLYPSTPFMPAEIAEWKRRWQWAARKCLTKAKEFE